MLTLPTNLSLRLLKQAQSTRLSLPKRLRALSELAQGIDQAVTLVPTQVLLEATKAPACPFTADIATVLDEAAHLIHAQLLPRMRRYRVQIVAVDQLSEAQRTWLWHYFQQQIYPLLTPLAIDSGHPFPYLQSRRLNFLVSLRNQSQPIAKPRYGVVQIPARLPRLIQAQPCLPSSTTANRARPLRCLVWREEIVRYFLPSLFSGLTVDAAYQFRLLRVQMECNPAGRSPQGGTLTDLQPGQPPAPVIRLDIEKSTPAPLRRWLINQLRVNDECVLDCMAPLGLADLCQLADYLAPH